MWQSVSRWLALASRTLHRNEKVRERKEVRDS
jgi:hypothetical protein